MKHKASFEPCYLYLFNDMVVLAKYVYKVQGHSTSTFAFIVLMFTNNSSIGRKEEKQICIQGSHSLRFTDFD